MARRKIKSKLYDITSTAQHNIFLTITDQIWYNFIHFSVWVEFLFLFYKCILFNPGEAEKHIQVLIYIFNLVYFFDILMISILKHRKYIDRHLFVWRPWWIIILEVISVLPFESFFTPKNKIQQQIHDYVKLIHGLKLVRSIYYFYKLRSEIITQNNIFRVIEVFFFVATFQLVAFFISYSIFCWGYTCTENWKLSIVEVFSGTINGKGCILSFLMNPSENYNFYNFNLPLIFLMLAYAALIIYPLTCIMILQTVCRYLQKYQYVLKVVYFKSTSRYRLSYNLDEDSHNRILEYYRVFWNVNGGFTTQEQAESINKLNQYILSTEMFLENCWPLFKHSQLFNDVDLNILRYLSNFIPKIIYMPGQNIFTQFCIKNSMIYILSGAISVISKENGESGVLTFSEGTCLGESSLIFPYISNTDFRCESPCELYVLERKHIISIIRNYPVAFRRMQKKVLSRYAIGKSFSKYREIKTELESGEVKWLKNTLHRLMSVTETQKFEHLNKNIFFQKEIDLLQKQWKYHTYKYLNLLAVKGRYCTDIDIVFIKSTCMWILRPNSPLLNLWEYFILSVSFCTLILVPYTIAFGNSPYMKVVLALIYILFLIDILVQIITPVDSNSRARTILNIIGEKLKTWGFIMDLISIIPGQILYVYLLRDALIFQRNWIEVNKILKIWRFYRFFSEWDNRFHHNIILQKSCYIAFFCFMLIYYTSCIFIIFGVEDRMFSILSIQIATGIGFCNLETNRPPSFLYTILNTLAFLLIIFSIIGISSALLIINMQENEISRKINAIIHCAKKSESSGLVLRGLNNYINLQLNENNGIMLIENMKTYASLPFHMHIILKSQLHLRILLSNEILCKIPFRILENLAAHSFLKSYPGRSNIIFRGIVYEDIYILVKGSVVVVSGLTTNFAEASSALNLLEMLYKTPSTRSVTALTDVQMLKFNFKSFLDLLKEEKLEWKSFVRAIKINNSAKNHLNKTLQGQRYMLRLKDRKEPSFFTFTGHLVEGSFEEYDYYGPFDKLPPGLFFLCRVLLARTINPNGNFMFYWEICKSICAILTAFLFVVPVFGCATISSKLAIPLICLDVFGYVDVYLRFHIAYYGKNGIIIKHPLLTAKNYWDQGLMMDVIALIPFNFFMSNSQLNIKTFINMIRYVQLVRFVAFTKSFNAGRYRSIYKLLLCIVWYYLVINGIASYIFSSICKETSPGKIECEYLKRSQMENFIYIFYFVTNIASTTGINIKSGEFRDLHTSSLLQYELGILSFLAISCKVYFTSYILAERITLFGKKFRLRSGFAYLLQWLKYQNISFFLQNEIKKYYDFYWFSLGKCNPIELYRCLNRSLRRELLFNYYKTLVFDSNIHAEIDDMNNFYKNLLLYAQPEVFCKGGYVITVNDIESNIFFLYKGKVDVVAADGTILIDLTQGAIFGNLENESFFRQRVSVVACTDVHVVSLKSIVFYRIIDNFPNVKKSFMEQKIRNLYYIKSAIEDDNYSDLYMDIIKKSKKFNKLYIFFENNFLTISYFFIPIALYQIGTMELNIFFNLIFLLWDFCIFIYIITKKYEGKISKFFLKTRTFMTYLTIFLAFPFDITFISILWALNMNIYSFYIIILTLRIIRLTRIYYVALYRYQIKIKSGISKAPSSIKRIFNAVYTVVTLCLLISAILLHLDFYYGNPYDDTYIYHGKDRFLIENLPMRSLFERVSIFTTYVFHSTSLFLAEGSGPYYPVTLINFCVYIILFTFWEVIYALLFVSAFDIIANGSFISLRILDVTNYIHFYLKEKNVTPILKEKVFKSLKNHWMYNKIMSDSLLTENCPRYLRQTIRLRAFGYLFKEHPVFCNTHFDFLRQLVDCVKLCIYSSNDVIIYKNTDRKCMYFIVSGKVAVFQMEIDDNKNRLMEISETYSFGILQGLRSNCFHKYTYKALTKCEILELEYDNWEYLLPFFPASIEVIFEKSQAFEDATHCELIKK